MAIIGTTKVDKYPKPHGSQGSGGTTVWRGSIKNSDLPGTVGIGSISADKGFIGDLSGDTLSYNEGKFVYLFAEDGTVQIIRGNELRYKSGKIDDFAADVIHAGKIFGDELNIDGNGWIKSLNSHDITTEFLTVTKQAHFFELIIDKVRSVGGSIILTATNCIADYVKPVDINGDHLPKVDDGDGHLVEDLTSSDAKFFDIYWMAEDPGTGRQNSNDWKVNDQAYCQAFSNAQAGVSHNVTSKYYWRLVTSILPQVYMNLRTGEELAASQATQAQVNAVKIVEPSIKYEDDQGNEYTIDIGWQVTPQEITGIVTGVTWTQDTGGVSEVTEGTMMTVNTIFGIQLSPIADTDLSNAVPETFVLDTESPVRLNIGFYYEDGTSEWFPAPQDATDHYEYLLKAEYDDLNDVYYSTTQTPIKIVVITNADEVEWHLVHGIRLSNTDCDGTLVGGTASIPAIGDNIAQLGYRPSSNNDPDINRGNAIIIAAYQTPDNGTGQEGSYRQYPIVPPSYAQYKQIGTDPSHYYELAWYRHTSMDANGSRFIGNFYTSGGTDIEQLIQTGGADFYQLFEAWSHTDNGAQAPMYPDGTTWVKRPQGGTAYEYHGTCSEPITLQQGETEDQAIARVEFGPQGTTGLKFSDYNWVLVPGSTGTPGGHWVNAYKNDQSMNSAPEPPNVNGVPKELNELPYNGWYSTPQALPTGYYTWMSQAFVSGNGNYQPWQTAVRLTGADGTDGTDGNDIEFIYYRNNGDVDGDPLTPPAPPNGHTYRDDWPATYSGSTKTSDHETITVSGHQYTWYDNPQGVGDYPNDPNAYLYEYMSQRMKRNGTWSDYTTPVLWSNWGKKGQDGDGYEYIYVLTGPQCPQGYQGPQGPQTPPSDPYQDEYFSAPWTDDPTGVSEGKNREWCSMRKKQDGRWGNYSTPALWAQWVPAGTQGPQGPQGNTGPAGSSYFMADQGSKAYYSIKLDLQNNTVTDWKIELKYNIFKRTAGDQSIAMTQQEIIDAGIRPYALIKKTNASGDSYIWYRFNITTENGKGLCTLTYNKPSSGWTNSDVQRFVYNHPSIRVALLPNNSDHYSENASELSQKYDEVIVPFNISNNAQWCTYTGDYSLDPDDPGYYASIKGLVTNQVGTQAVIDEQILGPQGIQGRVTALNREVYGTENPSVGQQSIIDQQAGQITLMAGDISGIQNDLTANYATKGYVGVQTDAVYLGVQNALYDTGIDIGQQSITLKANKVTFANSTGTVTNKISIDPTTGTLHAENGDFSGTLNISLMYTGVKEINSGTDYAISFNDPFNTYVVWIPQTGERNLWLPNVDDTYIGLEYEFFSPRLARTTNNGLSHIVVNNNNPTYIRFLDSDNFVQSTNTKLMIPFNKFIKVKLMKLNGILEWWVTTGDRWIERNSQWWPMYPTYLYT